MNTFKKLYCYLKKSSLEIIKFFNDNEKRMKFNNIIIMFINLKTTFLLIFTIFENIFNVWNIKKKLYTIPIRNLKICRAKYLFTFVLIYWPTNAYLTNLTEFIFLLLFFFFAYFLGRFHLSLVQVRRLLIASTYIVVHAEFHKKFCFI